MIQHAIETDERTVAVDHAAAYHAYVIVSWMLLLALVVRSLRPDWVTIDGFPVDILGVIACGAVTHTLYMLRHQAFGRRRSLLLSVAVGLAALVAALVVFALALLT